MVAQAELKAQLCLELRERSRVLRACAPVGRLDGLAAAVHVVTQIWSLPLLQKESCAPLSGHPVLVLLALPHLSLHDHRIHCVPTIETQGIIPLHIGISKPFT